ncbi:DUF3631 domain-containing protein [Pseudonocardia dioxanivorans]|uniref:DUF3631 domain-containing protein n=1 Tax=Pseudonocardia dioxanivorans TaxID=240495 RepID=UPI000CD1C5BE|nr:DUF3631 domain-containing protein [Pseudonocardia dioxanivorans]
MTLAYPPPDPSVDGARILDRVERFFRRYVAFPTEHAFVVVVLWAAHTHATGKTWYVTPRLVLDSAEPGSGKTRVLEILALLVLRPQLTISATTAAIFRMLDEQPYTLLFDEVDAIFNPRNGGNYEDLRALLNAGYKQGATIARCVGDAKKMRVQHFEVFAPVALAGLAGKMPATITTRAVTIHMRRRAPGEKVEPFRERDAEHQAEPIRETLAAWIEDISSELADARPDMPSGVEDRPAEVWEALLAVADAAGGQWPQRAREACSHFVLNTDPGEVSLGIRLLTDIHALFTRDGTDRMASAAIIDALVALDEAPWADLYGKALDPRRLSGMLRRYGVEAKDIKLPDGSVKRGYRTDGPDGLHDAWVRYLHSRATSATTTTDQVNPVALPTPVVHTSATAQPSATGLTSEVAVVADVAQNNETRLTGVWRGSGEAV